MATQNPNCYDFSDLGSEVSFKFNEETYIIPPITPKKSRELFALSQKAVKEAQKKQKELMDFQKKIDDAEKKQEDAENSSDIKEIIDIPENMMMDTDIFRSQLEYINCATGIDITLMDENWPTKLVIRVVKLINDTMSGTASNEEKKE